MNRHRWKLWSFWILAALMISIFGVLPAATQQDDSQSQAQTLLDEGVELFLAYQFEVALPKFEEALSLYRDVNERREALCLQFIGLIKHNLSDYPGALVAFNASLVIWQRIPDRMWAGITLNNIGAVYYVRGQYKEALAYYKEALAIQKEIKDWAGVGVTLNNIGLVYRALGEYEEVLAQLQRALAIAQALDDPKGEGVTLNNIGVVYYSLGRYEEALARYQEALTIQQEIDDRKGEGVTLNNIGLVYRAQGRYEEALARYQEALTIQQEIDDRKGEGVTLTNIGAVYHALRLYEKALVKYQEALTIRQEIGDRKGVGETLNNMGVVYYDLRQYEKALAQLQQVLTIRQEIGDQSGEGTTLNNIGVVCHVRGQYKEALNQFQQALDIQQAIGASAGEALTLNNIGAVYHTQRCYEKALVKYQKALTIRQAIGDRKGVGETLENIGFLYEAQRDLSKAINYYRQAVEVVESIQGNIKVEELASAFAGEQVPLYARLIQLLEQTGDSVAAFDYAERARARAFLNLIGNSPVDFRRDAADALLEEEHELCQKLIGLQNAIKDARNELFNQQQLDNLTAKLEATRTSYEALLIQLKLRSPEYASLISVNTLNLGEVQSQVLDEETTLIEYFVMNEQTLAWIIDQEGFELVKLEITSDDLENNVTFLRNLIATHDFDIHTATSLYQSLFAPLTPHIRHRNLIIVPHGVLQYLSFAALWDAENECYLLKDYALTYAPSASILNFSLEKRNPNSGRLLALGNPDGSLPHAETEVEAIAGLYGTTPLLGWQATESQIYAQAGQLDVLHLAAHGVYDKFNPLFTHIELAGDEQADGYLEVHEVFGLDLTGANLVVLSACNTTLGQQSKGDEIVGLNRAFLYAGSPAVITSLWTIDDEASGVLMRAFYCHLRDGQTTARALQAAQLEVLEQEKWNTPYFWAAFVLMGDYL